MQQDTLKNLDEEVKQLADEQSEELLPLLFEKLIARDGLTTCRRHLMLPERIRAEIALTKARRWARTELDVSQPGCEFVDTDNFYSRTLKRTLKIRKEYRSRPCTCWVSKR